MGVVSQDVRIRLLDDQEGEGMESFHVKLVEGEGLSNAILHGNVISTITITDIEDCKLVKSDEYFIISIRRCLPAIQVCGLI